MNIAISVREKLTAEQITKILKEAVENGFNVRNGLAGHNVYAPKDLIERLTPEPFRSQLPKIEDVEVGFIGNGHAVRKDSFPWLKPVYDRLEFVYKSV